MYRTTINCEKMNTYLATLINAKRSKIRSSKCTTKPVTQRYVLVQSVRGPGAAVRQKAAPLSNVVAAKQAGHFALGQVHGQGRSVLPGCRTLCLRGMGRRTAYVIVAAYAIIASVAVFVDLFYSMWYIAHYLHGMLPV